MIASLPMYDRSETSAANDRLWGLMREDLAGSIDDLPFALTRSANPWDDWQSGDLLFSQTCSMPYRMKLWQTLTVIGSPVSSLNCPEGYYFSVFVKRSSDLRMQLEDFAGAVLAVNDMCSQSGWAAAQAALVKADVTIAQTVETGAHWASAEAVATGRADLAALDAVTWSMIRKWDQCADNLEVLTKTNPTPALPFVTGYPEHGNLLFKALKSSISKLSAEDRDALGLCEVIQLPESAYGPPAG